MSKAIAYPPNERGKELLPLAENIRLDSAHWPDTTDLLVCVLLGALTLITFSPALSCDFVNFDDDKLVTANPHVIGGITAEGVRWALANLEQGFYFPLTWLSLQLDAQLYGLKPWGYHLTNILLHAANAILLFWFLRAATGSRWRSAAAAAFFAVHPLRVESVAWVTERKDVLCAFFGFLTLIAYVGYARRPTWGAFFRVFGLFVLSILSKSMLAALPGVLLVLDFWPLRRVIALRTVSRPLLLRLMFEKVILIVPAAAVTAMSAVGLAREGAFSIERTPALARIANAVVSYERYVLKTGWPGQLAVFYPLQSPPLWLAIASVAAFVLTTALALGQARRRPWLAAGWMWYVLALVPMVGLPVIAWADRFSYFPCIGLLIMLFWSLPDPGRGWRWKIACAGAELVVLLIFCLATRKQISYWKDSLTLWAHTLEVTGENWLAQGYLGSEIGKVGDADVAEMHFRESIRLNPAAAFLHYNFGNLLLKQNKLDAAADQYRQTLLLDPGIALAYANLGVVAVRRHDYPAAARLFAQTVDRMPGYAQGWFHLGLALYAMGDFDGAAAAYRQTLRFEPTFEQARLRLQQIEQMNRRH